jgi:hypothetical protein
MKATISANGKTIKTEITEEQAKELGLIAKKKTGYERVEYRDEYYSVNVLGGVDDTCDVGLITDKAAYFDGNYYSDEKIAENNAKADRLLRKLRQWQALNDEPVNKRDLMQLIFTIGYDYKKDDAGNDAGLYAYSYHRPVSFGEIHFSTRDKVKEAINVFKDELTWYFTEYQQRLDETMQ